MHLLLASFYGDPRLGNGPAQMSRALGDAWLEKGHRLTTWSCAVAPAGESQHESREIVAVPFGHGGQRPPWLASWRPDPKVRAFAREALRRERPDVVLLGAWKHLGEVALAAREAGIPVVLFLHDYSILCLRSWLLHSSGNVCSGPETLQKCVDCLSSGLGPRGRLRRRLTALPALGGLLASALGQPRDRHWSLPASVRAARAHMEAVLEAADTVVAQSPRARKILLANGVGDERIRVLPQAADPAKVLASSPSREPFESPEGEERPLRFVFVGRWAPGKGVALLVEAFLAARLHRPCELWLVLSNPQAVKLPPMPGEEAKRIRIFAGFRGQASSEVLAQGDLCIVPSLCEDLASRAVLEALANGVPVAASETVGNAYLIEDGVNGRVLPATTVAELRIALMELVEQISEDPDVLQRWSRELPSPPNATAWLEGLTKLLETHARGAASIPPERSPKLSLETAHGA